jgi:selenide, water dikinase
MERVEDAGVYKLSDELAIIQSVDFFTPIVDDPFTYGQIAAANALSDIYAMGGKPLTALNILCFPIETMDISVMREVIKGGLDKMLEAGVVLMGGHSVNDTELKYGLAVTGTIHPKKVLRKVGGRAGDLLILTKPLGTGIVSTAIKQGTASTEVARRTIKSMVTLNRTASEVMLEVGVHASTDVTGFGLLGHAAEMVEKTTVGIVIHAAAVPVFPGVKELAEAGMLSGGLQRNREFRLPMVDVGKNIPPYLADILFDPQTSGGLLIAISKGKAVRLLNKLHQAGVTGAAVIGEVSSEPRGRISVT